MVVATKAVHQERSLSVLVLQCKSKKEWHKNTLACSADPISKNLDAQGGPFCTNGLPDLLEQRPNMCSRSFPNCKATHAPRRFRLQACTDTLQSSIPNRSCCPHMASFMESPRRDLPRMCPAVEGVRLRWDQQRTVMVECSAA